MKKTWMEASVEVLNVIETECTSNGGKDNHGKNNHGKNPHDNHNDKPGKYGYDEWNLEFNDRLS